MHSSLFDRPERCGSLISSPAVVCTGRLSQTSSSSWTFSNVCLLSTTGGRTWGNNVCFFFYSTRSDPHEPNLKSEGNTDLLSAAAFVVTRRCRASWLRSLLCENVSQISATNFPAWQLSMYNEIIWYSVATNYVQFGDVSGDMRETQITFHL